MTAVVRNLETGRRAACRQLSRILEKDILLEALTSRSARRIFPMDKVQSCLVERVHFGSKLGIVVEISVGLAGGEGRTRSARIFGQIPWGSAQLAYHKACEQLAERNRVGDVSGWIGLIEPLGLLVRRPGADERLVGLRVLHDPEPGDEETLATLAGEGASPGRLQLLAHRLGKRAVLRLEFGAGGARRAALRTSGNAAAGADPSNADTGNDAGTGAGRESLIVKLYKRGSMQAQAAKSCHAVLARALAKGDGEVGVPEILAVLPQFEGVVMKDAAASDLSRLSGSGRLAGMALAGRSLARLHDCEVLAPACHGPADEIELLLRWADFSSEVAAPGSARLAPAVWAVMDLLKACTPYRACPIHRDFHERQLLVSRGSAIMIDFDTISVGDPAQDVGNFLAHLRWAEILGAAPACSSSAAFISGYQSAQAARRTLSQRNVEIHYKATLLRLAIINHYSQERAEAVEALLDEVLRT